MGFTLTPCNSLITSLTILYSICVLSVLISAYFFCIIQLVSYLLWSNGMDNTQYLELVNLKGLLIYTNPPPPNPITLSLISCNLWAHHHMDSYECIIHNSTCIVSPICVPYKDTLEKRTMCQKLCRLVQFFSSTVDLQWLGVHCLRSAVVMLKRAKSSN
jgi:hypothetical protein